MWDLDPEIAIIKTIFQDLKYLDVIITTVHLKARKTFYCNETGNQFNEERKLYVDLLGHLELVIMNIRDMLKLQ